MTSSKLARFSSISRSLLSQPTRSRTLNNNSINTVRRNSLSGASDTEISSLFSSIRSGVVAKHETSSGVGGVYFLKDLSNNLAAVFKPCDEEALPVTLDNENGDNVASNKITMGYEVKSGIFYGEGYLKECAAYLMDKGNFHGVPPTTLFAFSNSLNSLKDSEKMVKFGSVQKYVSHVGTAEDMGWKLFPVHEVHKIGILDCRLLNTDRHMGNILVTKGVDGSFRLIPIDHGLCLPATLEGGYFEWMSFPQAKQPFAPETLRYISELDADADVATLRTSLPKLRRECLDTLKICTILLKKAAACGLTLYQIGCIMTRYLDIDEPSELEKLRLRVDAKMRSGAIMNFWDLLEDEIDLLLYNIVSIDE